MQIYQGSEMFIYLSFLFTVSGLLVYPGKSTFRYETVHLKLQRTHEFSEVQM